LFIWQNLSPIGSLRKPVGARIVPFQLLKKLPDNYFGYYEPNIENRRPDFVVIAPDLGVIVIEVKGWHIEDIAQGSDTEITIHR